MDKLRESVLLHARSARAHLSDDEWLKLARLCQVQRYELNKLIDEDLEVTPVTYMRIAAGLEQVGYKTRLSELDSATRSLVMDLGTTVLGEIKDYFPKDWDRQPFTQYICRGAAYSPHMEEKVKKLAAELKRGATFTDKPKVDVSDVEFLKFKLNHQPSTTKASQPLREELPDLLAQLPTGEGGFVSPEEQFKVYASELTVLANTFLNMKEGDRERLRKVVGQDRIFHLKNLLSRLCGSKAFGNRQ